MTTSNTDTIDRMERRLNVAIGALGFAMFMVAIAIGYTIS